MIMLFSLIAAASAATPEGVAAVHGVRGAWPIVLGAPFQYSWTATPQALTEATVLVVDADPEWLRMRQTDTPGALRRGRGRLAHQRRLRVRLRDRAGAWHG